MVTVSRVNIGSGNGLVPAGTKPLPELLLNVTSEIQWHSHENKFTSAQATILYNEFENYIFKFTATSTRVQQVNCPLVGTHLTLCSQILISQHWCVLNHWLKWWIMITCSWTKSTAQARHEAAKCCQYHDCCSLDEARITAGMILTWIEYGLSKGTPQGIQKAVNQTCQYCGGWCASHTQSQDISKHDIDLVFPCPAG